MAAFVEQRYCFRRGVLGVLFDAAPDKALFEGYEFEFRDDAAECPEQMWMRLTACGHDVPRGEHDPWVVSGE